MNQPAGATSAPYTGSDWRPRFLRANGMEFAYLEAGAGPLVLCLHGFPDTAWSFCDLLQRLEDKGFHAVAPFMRGYAPSAVAKDRDYSVTALGRDVAALVEAFGEKEAMVVGHDWGAAAAYAAASLAPHCVTRIVAAAVPPVRRFLFSPTRRQLRASHYMFKFQLPGWPERRIRENGFEWLMNLAQSWSPDWELPASYSEPVKAAFAEPARLQAALGYYRAMPQLLLTRVAWQTLLKPLPVPTRVIFGEQDRCILPEMFRDLHGYFSAEWDCAGIAGAGHFMHLEAPDAFAAGVIEFLKPGRRPTARGE